MKEFLDRIGIKEKGEYTSDDVYVIDLKDYDIYGKYFSLLDRCDEVEEVLDTSMITFHTTTVTYTSDEFQIVLQADLDEDLYKIVVTKF